LIKQLKKILKMIFFSKLVHNFEGMELFFSQ